MPGATVLALSGLRGPVAVFGIFMVVVVLAVPIVMMLTGRGNGQSRDSRLAQRAKERDYAQAHPVITPRRDGRQGPTQ
jgi:hypothetical protein